jgi:pilus assembly protein Flp/PilA
MGWNRLTALVQRVRDRGFSAAFRVRQFLTRREEGATLVEYALLVALIAIACIVAIAALGNDIKNAFTNIGNNLTNNI